MNQSNEKVQLISLDSLQGNNLISLQKTGLSKQRQNAIKQFYSGQPTISQKVKDSTSVKDVMNTLVQQLARTYDNMCGVEQMFLNNGQLANSTIIADKKAQILQRLSAIMKKLFDIDAKSRSIDVDSPQVKILITILFEKFVAVINTYVDSPDLQILIINTFKQSLKTWDKQFKQRIKNLEK